MKEVVNKFLDNYIGKNINIKSITDNEYHSFFSDNGELILSIRINIWNKSTYFRGDMLCKTVAGFFSISKDKATDYIRDWFNEKHNSNNPIEILNSYKK
jgi:hypothetical protein